jgi:tRNA (guanine-N7-)-methyltransferase
MSKSYISLGRLLPRVTEAPEPLDWASCFGRVAPVELEIGCGNGEYLAQRAGEIPEHDFVGIELLWGRVKKTLRKLALAERDNAKLLYGEASTILNYLVPERSLARVHTLYPCPWPGDDDGRHRLYTPPFLKLVNSRLQEGGRVTLVTDDAPYFEWLLEQLPGTGFRSKVETIGADYGTKFENKWREGGQSNFHRLELVKTEHFDRPLRREKDMRIHRIARFEASSFEPPEWREDGILVRCRDFLHDPGQKRGMARMVIVEPELTQELWVEIRPDGDDWVVAPAKGCSALMTEGAQRALDVVAEAAGHLS